MSLTSVHTHLRNPETVSGKGVMWSWRGESVGRVLMVVFWVLGVGFWRVGAAESATSSKEAHSSSENWWSFRPLLRPPVPQSEAGEQPLNPVDAFVRARWAEHGLKPSVEADRRTLIRRLSFDLLGLPPTWEQVRRFERDARPDAYERLVDEFLASPHYGERWARHWLDVVHYGETHGYDKDQPRPNAWPYRDYLIRAFNEDRNYTRFVEEQLAGDVLYPLTRDGIEGLGFIAAGPWDLIGHAEVPETKMDGQVARHLDRDDMVMNTLQTFNSLTVQCAQCHDHKFDPISAEDYYKLQAVFAAVDRTNRKYDTDPWVARRRFQLEERKGVLVARRDQLEKDIRVRAGEDLVRLENEIAALKSVKSGSAAFGYHSNIEKDQDRTKWVQVDLGRSAVLGQVVLHPTQDDFAGIGAGFGFPVRYRVDISEDPEFQRGVVTVLDRTSSDQANPKLKAQVAEVAGKSARYVRVTATRLALRDRDYIFALAELSVLGMDGGNLARGAVVSSLDSIEAPVRWQRVNLTDGVYPGGGSADEGLVARKSAARDRVLAEATTEMDRMELDRAEAGLKEVQAGLKELPAQSVAYVGSVHTGSGAFVGTGGKGGKPRPIHVLARGAITKPGKEVGPGALTGIPGLRGDLQVAADRPEGERRAALARWIVQKEHPLTWRSIVNRVWQYHFGRGLVETSNDFGRMGALPTHPELLDWLAVEFRDGGQSLKKLHRLMVTSVTYRQSSLQDAAMMSLDPDNRYLSRMTRRKLEAEVVRDSVLMVAGRMDWSMGGPSFQDFVIDKPEHSPHYEYHLHDPEDARSHRRSVYRFIVRSQPQPFMSVLDCADSSLMVGRRNESVTPLQALAMLNNDLMIVMAKHFAVRVEGEAAGKSVGEKVDAAYRIALGRLPGVAEREAMVAYVGEQGLTNLCRVIFNLNEFSFAD